jgi:hypothetical protein
MNKKLLKKIFLVFIPIFLSINFAFAQSDTYQNVSTGLDNASTTIISNTSTGGLADTARYIGLMAAAAIITLVIFKLIEGAVLKGTYDNIYDQQKGNKILKNAITSFLIFIFVNLLFSYINPDYGSWIFNSSTGVTQGSSSNCSPITPKLTAYSPQDTATNGNSKMEGGQGSAQAGIDGKPLVRTLEDVRTGKSTYVTLAGDSSTYKNKYTIPSITYLDKSGQSHTLTNVTAYVHDTGNAFKGAGYSHFDVAIDSNMTTSALNKEPFTNTSITLSPQECVANSYPNLITPSLYASNQERCNAINSIKQNDLTDIKSLGIPCTSSYGCLLKTDTANNLKLMEDAYKSKYGKYFTVTSAYRSDSQQVTTCDTVSAGEKCAVPCSKGGPGSNHSLGDAVDVAYESNIVCKNGNNSGCSNSITFNWLKQNAINYNFRQSSTIQASDPVHWSVSGK